MSEDHTDDLEELKPDWNARERSGMPQALRTILEFAIALVIAVGLTWLVKSFVLEPYEVPTGSMETTIMIGDKLLAEKISYNFNAIQAGDIIVFADKVLPGRVLVKRVIALGGQVVDLRDGTVYVDGSPLYEPYIVGAETHPLNSTLDNMVISYPYTVPQGSLWVMGDNRDSSADSRFFGAVTESSVFGRAMMVFWPLENIGPL
jgi:signal peptidase I